MPLVLPLPKNPRSVLSIISEDDASPRPPNADQGFHHHPLALDPAIAGRSLDHGVLARYLVSRQRQVEALACGGDHIEIRHRRFYHDHVGAFLPIEFDIALRLPPIPPLLLIGSPVPELRS